MAGVESMIVEEKHPPPKQIDREKVGWTLAELVRLGSYSKMASAHSSCDGRLSESMTFSPYKKNIQNLQIFLLHLRLLDLPAVTTCILFDRPSSFAQRISARQRATKWAPNLHVARCDAAWNYRPGAWGEPGDTAQGNLLWLCSRLTGSV